MDDLQASRVSQLQYEAEMNTMPPESQFSLNWQMIDQFGGNVQVTMRAAFIGEWPDIMGSRKDFCVKAQEAGWTFPGTVRPAAAPVASKPANGTATVTTPASLKNLQVMSAAQPAAEQSFTAELLTGSLYEGKPSWKVKGGQFNKFGVTIWPEALEAAGMGSVEIDKQPYTLAGYTAFYLTKPDGKPQKVVKLVAPASEPF